MTTDRRWISLIVLCIGMLMIVLDVTVVNVALPSIQADLPAVAIGLVVLRDRSATATGFEPCADAA